jgi:CelD/BcsL family acetyltransferase involved in cellulose biosynthesis
MHEQSSNYSHLLEITPSNRVAVFSKPGLPYIDASTIELATFKRAKKKSTFADARRCERRLAEFGTLELKVLTRQDSPGEQVIALYENIQRKFGESFLHRADDLNKVFLKALADRHMDASNFLEYSTLTLDGRAIASNFGFNHKGRRSYYLTDYDRKFEAYSPSKVLMKLLIERSFTEGGVFCFGSGMYSYKFDWCQAVAELKCMWVCMSDTINPAFRQVIEHRQWGFCGKP